MAKRRNRRPPPPPPSTALPVGLLAAAVTVALLLVAGISGWYLYQTQRPDRTGAVPASADGAGVKVGTGPVRVDVYLDFICPACKAFEERAAGTLDQLVRSGKVTIVYHPLAYLDQQSTTGYSSRSAAASGCAADAGKFVEYAGALYDRQPAEGGPGLTDDDLVELAKQAGIDPSAFGTCVRDGRYAGWVDGVTEQAARGAITGTPTIKVNQRQVDPAPEAITAAVGQ
jgi:protein-disulfide isomerase